VRLAINAMHMRFGTIKSALKKGWDIEGGPEFDP
jgi:hypothetical protein